MKFINIEKDKIPYNFDLVVDGITYTFTINYNTTYNYFTFDLHIKDRPIVFGQKLVYMQPTFSSVMYRDVPPIGVVPYDISGQATRCGHDELNEEVMLWIDDAEDEEGDYETMA